jgi:hypothetical protein
MRPKLGIYELGKLKQIKLIGYSTCKGWNIIISSIIIIINGKTVVVEPWPSLGDSATFVYSGYVSWIGLFCSHFFGIHNSNCLQSNVVSLASNPQPGGPDPSIYVPQWQIGPVIPQGTGLSFCRLLRLAGLQRKYFNPRPHGKCNIIVSPKSERIKPLKLQTTCNLAMILFKYFKRVISHQL